MHGKSVDGEMTLAENIADSGGVKVCPRHSSRTPTCQGLAWDRLASPQHSPTPLAPHDLLPVLTLPALATAPGEMGCGCVIVRWWLVTQLTLLPGSYRDYRKPATETMPRTPRMSPPGTARGWSAVAQLESDLSQSGYCFCQGSGFRVSRFRDNPQPFTLHQVSYEALLKLHPKSSEADKQLFFLSWGQTWCSVQRKKTALLALEDDEHAPGTPPPHRCFCLLASGAHHLPTSTYPIAVGTFRVGCLERYSDSCRPLGTTCRHSRWTTRASAW